MVEEARLEAVGSGLAPVSDGWFVVNVAEAAWLRNDAFGNRCVFESSPRVLGERPDLEPRMFAQVGFTLAVLEPGKPSGMYHGESNQEDFLVLAGSVCWSSRAKSGSCARGISSIARPGPSTSSSEAARAHA